LHVLENTRFRACFKEVHAIFLQSSGASWKSRRNVQRLDSLTLDFPEREMIDPSELIDPRLIEATFAKRQEANMST
jgi:hypothetical protein